jgi:hypothetical protein
VETTLPAYPADAFFGEIGLILAESIVRAVNGRPVGALYVTYFIYLSYDELS